MTYCCGRWFEYQQSLNQHRCNSRNHNWCTVCDRDFSSSNALRQHKLASSAHDYCGWCDCEFQDWEELEEHNDEQHPECCNQNFRTVALYNQHQEDSHWYCKPCKRIFQNQNNLNAHLNSSLHKPKTVKCPGRGCTQSFISHAALALHLEAGTCASGATRAAINRYVRDHDTNNIITNPARMITGSSSYSDLTYVAGPKSWNGQFYECYLCGKEFGRLTQLNSHLNSPRHADKIYRCPDGGCRKEFSALSALWMHVESESCGVQRFSNARRAMEQLIDGTRRLAF